MPNRNIRIPTLMGGVSTVSQNQRLPIEVSEMENCDILTTRGVDKRAGTEHIDGDGSAGELNVAEPDNDVHSHWIDRDTDERFVLFIDPDAADDKDIIQVWNITTGDEVVVKAEDSSGSEVDLDDADADVAAMVGYLTNGTQTPQQRFRTLTVEDGTFILNRTVETELEGTAITYTNSDSPSEVRNQNNDQNVTAFSDFDHPPSDTDTYPSRSTLVSGGTINNDAIWYAEDDDIGLPQGFYFAVSSTQPPWFDRLPTEGANSFIKRDTMPLLLTFDGTKFVLKLIDWTPRKSGDSTTNPGPSFIGNAIDDISFHQGRLWFASGERVVSTRAGDIENCWIDSTALVTDGDPIDSSIQNTRISNIRLLESFRESLIMLTTGARQAELRANGPITPQSFQLYNSTDIFTANYVEPTRRGSQLYFAGERDASMLIWEYDYSPQQVSNVAVDLTRRVHGYIPAEADWMTASQTHEQLFITTLPDKDTIFVNLSVWEGNKKALNSWYKWTYPEADDIISCSVFDDYLYMVIKRGDLWYLERQALGQPLQETQGSQTLGYALRMDRREDLQGSYDSGTNKTTFTLSYLDGDATYQLVTGPEWDTDTVKGAGTQITDLTVGSSGGVTTIEVDGDLENNSDGDNAKCYIGVQYEARIELSEQFVRDQNGNTQHGNTNLTRMRVRHRDSGGYSVKITPEGRNELTKDFVVPNVGSTPLDAEQLDEYGEFQLRVMTHSANSTIELSNDTPFPTAWIDCDFDAVFVPTYSPVR